MAAPYPIFNNRTRFMPVVTVLTVSGTAAAIVPGSAPGGASGAIIAAPHANDPVHWLRGVDPTGTDGIVMLKDESMVCEWDIADVKDMRFILASGSSAAKIVFQWIQKLDM